jgi:hypothetical protein
MLKTAEGCFPRIGREKQKRIEPGMGKYALAFESGGSCCLLAGIWELICCHHCSTARTSNTAEAHSY